MKNVFLFGLLFLVVLQYCIDKQKPYLIECTTFRMRGHEEASGVKYVPPHLFEEWKQKDPIQQYENYLLKEKILSLLRQKYDYAL